MVKNIGITAVNRIEMKINVPRIVDIAFLRDVVLIKRIILPPTMNLNINPVASG